MGSLRDWPSLVHQSCIAVKTPAVSSRGDNLAKRIVPRHSLFEWNSSLKPVERRHAQLFVFRPPLELRLVQILVFDSAGRAKLLLSRRRSVPCLAQAAQQELRPPDEAPRQPTNLKFMSGRSSSLHRSSP